MHHAASFRFERLADEWFLIVDPTFYFTKDGFQPHRFPEALLAGKKRLERNAAARHANMFLVRHAREVMDSDVLVLPAEDRFDAFLRQHEAEGRLRHIVVTQKGHLYGVIRVNTGLGRGLEGARTGVTLGDVASRDFTIVGEDQVAFDVIDR
jgi:hypothetical protein